MYKVGQVNNLWWIYDGIRFEHFFLLVDSFAGKAEDLQRVFTDVLKALDFH